jgi:hypothetical protein
MRAAQSYFDLYTCRWNILSRHVDVQLVRASVAAVGSGSYLSCGRMHVDCRGDQYLASTRCGFVALGAVDARRGDRWIVTVPPQTVFGEPEAGEIEDIFSLICTVGWRAEGWIAVHAGAVAKNEICALLCAPSGGGKSTLTAALVSNGWHTLGDDKLLFRIRDGVPVIASLLQTFNLDPRTRRWFDVGEIEQLPRYSAWTHKRRVHLAAIAPHAAMQTAEPTHLVVLERTHRAGCISASRLQSGEILRALLKQIVIPQDREAGRTILEAATRCALRMRGLRLEIGEDAYAYPGWFGAIEDAIARCRR